MLSQKSKHYLSLLGLFYCSLALGTHYIVTKQVANSIDSITLTAYRFLIAAIPLFVYLIIKRKNPFKQIKPGIILGFFLWLVFIAIAKGVQYTTATNAGFISGTFIIFVPILIYLIFKRAPKWFHFVSAIVALTGIYFLTGQLQKINVGDILILFSALATAIHMLLASKFAKQNLEPITLCFQQFTVVFLLSLIFTLINGASISIPSTQLGPLLFLGILPTLSVFFIQLLALKFTTETTAALIFSTQPIFAAAFAFLLGGEKMEFIQIFGGFLLVIAIIFNQLLQSNYQKKQLELAEKYD